MNYFLIIFILLIVGLIFFCLKKVNLKNYSVSGIVENDQIKTFDEKKLSLKIVSYNMGYASGMFNNRGIIYHENFIKNNLDNIVENIIQLDPQIVCLQEIDFYSDRCFGIDQVEYLSKKLGFRYMAYQINWNLNYLPWPGMNVKHHFGKIVSGQVIMSHYPIVEQKVEIFDKPKNNSWFYNLFYLNRSVQKVSIIMNNQKINLWHLHLEAFDQASRILQLEKILNQNLSKVDFILGDFNAEFFTDTQEREIFFNRLSHHQNAVNKAVKTYPSDQPLQRIDYILSLKKYHLIDQGVVFIEASDHLPIFAEFQL